MTLQISLETERQASMSQLVILTSGTIGHVYLTRWRDEIGDTMEICAGPTGLPGQERRFKTTPEMAALWDALSTLEADEELMERAADNGLAPICGWPE